MAALPDERLFCNICVLIHLCSRTWLICYTSKHSLQYYVSTELNSVSLFDSSKWYCKITNRGVLQNHDPSPPNGRISQRTRSYVQRGVNPEKIGESSCRGKDLPGTIWNANSMIIYDNFIHSTKSIPSNKLSGWYSYNYLVSNVWGYSAV